MAGITATVNPTYHLRRKVSDEIFDPIGGCNFAFQIPGGAILDNWTAQSTPTAHTHHSSNALGHRLYFRHARSRPAHPDTKQATLAMSSSIKIPFVSGETTLYDFDNGVNVYPFGLHTTSGETYQHTHREIYDIGLPRNYWVKSWLSPPANCVATLSAESAFTLKAGFTTKALLPGAYPVVSIFVWGANNTLKQRVTEKFSTVKISSAVPRYSYKEYFTDEPLGAPATLSVGDRIGVELAIRSGRSYGRKDYGFAYDGSAIDGSQYGYKSYIDFTFESPTEVTFVEEIQAGLDIGYDIKNELRSVDHDMYFRYNSKISSLMEGTYNIRRGIDYFDIETHSSLRGQASLYILPEYGSLSAGDDFWNMIGEDQYYLNRWASKKASLNEFEMIEDFEQYSTLGELTSSEDLVFVTDSAEDGTISFYKTYSETRDFSSYNYLSVLSKAENPTAMYAVFYDTGGQQTFPVNLAVKQERGRYESEIDWLGADSTKINKVEFFFEYDGWLIMDDFALIKAGDRRESVDWIPILLQDMDYSRQVKFNSQKIPEGGGEIFQHFGEYNAEGVLNMRSFDNNDALFLKTVLKDRRPIFLRLKNDGFPIYISKYEVNMVNQSAKNIQSEITAWFTEVYDSSL